MPGSSSVRAGIVTRLRAAGCVFAEDEAELLLSTAGTPADLEAMVDRRAAGEPLEHVLGWAEFCGLRIAVDPGVFGPRRAASSSPPEAVALARPGAVVVDLCCGTGAVGAVLARRWRASSCTPPTSTRPRCGAPSATSAPAGGQVYEGDLYDPLPDALRGRVDVLVANAPYVPTGRSASCPPRLACTSRWWRWTAARTGSTSCGG